MLELFIVVSRALALAVVRQNWRGTVPLTIATSREFITPPIAMLGRT
jgi:hypothetical protein